MESVYAQETDKISLIEEFNLITQNKDQSVAANVLEMCQYDLNVKIVFILFFLHNFKKNMSFENIK